MQPNSTQPSQIKLTYNVLNLTAYNKIQPLTLTETKIIHPTPNST